MKHSARIAVRCCCTGQCSKAFWFHNFNCCNSLIGETILATAASQDCDLLIKGAYTQVACGNGSATRHIVANATQPV
jgi:hypothetical protein